MRRICSWCGEILESGSAFPLLTTHGACAPCAKKLLASIADSSGNDLVCRSAEPLEGDVFPVPGDHTTHVVRRIGNGGVPNADTP